MMLGRRWERLSSAFIASLRLTRRPERPLPARTVSNFGFHFVRMLTLNAPGTGFSDTTNKYPPPQPEYIAPGNCAW